MDFFESYHEGTIWSASQSFGIVERVGYRSTCRGPKRLDIPVAEIQQPGLRIQDHLRRNPVACIRDRVQSSVCSDR